MDVYKTHGAFSWSELTTPDPAAAAEFYGQLFGWTTQDMGAAMGHYLMASVGDTGVCGIMSMPEGAPAGMPPHWGSYVTVDSVEAVLKRCGELGGGSAACDEGPADRLNRRICARSSQTLRHLALTVTTVTIKF